MKSLSENRARFVLGLILIIAVAVAYSSSFGGPFIFDGEHNIFNNESIKSIGTSFTPSENVSIINRPLINVTLAFNYLVSGTAPWSYHVFNLVIHILSTLLLFNIVQLALDEGKTSEGVRDKRLWLAFSSALLWGVHPLQTEAVTYIIQRCESVMALFVLLALLFAIKGWRSGKREMWHVLSLLSLGLGGFAKEGIVVASVLIILYDLIVRESKLKDFIQGAKVLYSGIVLITSYQIIRMAGYGADGTLEQLGSPLEYATNQTAVIIHYLKLSFWPAQLCLDYLWPIQPFSDVFLHVGFFVILAALSAYAVMKRNVVSYFVLWFWVCILPTSSFVPILDLAVERRMYLPLVGVIVFFVVGLYWIVDRLLDENQKGINFVLLALVFVAALALGGRTWVRNLDYQTAMTMWHSVAEVRPENGRAQRYLGRGYTQSNQYEKAVEHLRKSVALWDDSDSNWDLGAVLIKAGNEHEGMNAFREAARLSRNGSANVQLGIYFEQQMNLKEAVDQYEAALQKMGASKRTAAIHGRIGFLYARMGYNYRAKARTHIQQYLIVNPGNMTAKKMLMQLN
ncbi:MAG: hypothetical protein OCC46_14705 [Pseudodesulfovibrio sp.]